MIDEKALAVVYANHPHGHHTVRAIIEAYEAAKQPVSNPINKAALDQASAARTRYRGNTPMSIYSIEGEDSVFIAAYLEAVGKS